MLNRVKLFFIFSILIPLYVSATNPDPFVITKTGDTEIKIEIKNFGKDYTVTVSNKRGKNIYETNPLSLNHLVFSIDFKGLEEGQYQVSVRDEHKMRSLPIRFKKQMVDVNAEEESITYFPELENEGNSLMVKLNAYDDNDLKIKIKNEEGRSLYAEEIESKNGMIGKKFLFEPGDYVVTLNSKNYKAERILNIK